VLYVLTIPAPGSSHIGYVITAHTHTRTTFCTSRTTQYMKHKANLKAIKYEATIQYMNLVAVHLTTLLAARTRRRKMNHGMINESILNWDG
jgi:hypothetical protein